MIGTVGYKERLAGETWLLGLDLPEKSEFVPGQYVSLKVSSDGLRRSYSVASLPGEKCLDLVIDVAPMGVGSKYVLDLKVGDAVEILGYLGKFVVDEKVIAEGKQMVFVGTGAGVVPLKTMIENLLVREKYKGQVYLLWGMRYQRDLYWQKEVDKLQRDYDNFHFEITLSRPDDDWPGLRGHVQEAIGEIGINWGEAAVFLCGNQVMIEEMKELVVNKGVPLERVFYERFA